MHISLLFRVQTLSDVTTNINALYVMTVKAITDFFFFFSWLQHQGNNI